jgi:hypothetical protein
MTNTSLQAGPGGCAGNAGRVLASLFLLIFVVAGLYICGTGLRNWRADQRTRHWPTAACTITRSLVRPRGKAGAPYVWQVEYRYEYAGRPYTCDRYTLAASGSSYNYADEERLALQYPHGAHATCWVDPADPAKAVLAQGPAATSLWAVIPFGLVFAGFGAIPLWLIWSGAISGGVVQRGPAIPSTRPRGPGRVLASAFFLVFAVVGAVALWFMLLHPLLRARAAQASWLKVPCAVAYSGVAEHPGSGKDGPTYSMDVLYWYAVGGRRYWSNQFDFVGDSSGRGSKLALARRYPRGGKTVCYVNPADPLDAVLQPKLGNYGWWGALPAVFLLFGIGGLARTWVPGRRASGAASGPGASVAGSRLARPTLASPSNDMLTLRLSEGPLSRFVGFAIFAMLFDGVLALFIWQFAAGHFSGVFAVLWMLIWAAACLVLTGLTIHAAIAMFNPRVTVTLARGAVAPGASTQLQWTINGRYDRIQRLTLVLEARERATYMRGTQTSTDTHVFARVPLFETDRTDGMARGKCALHIPAGAMPTFRARNNEVRWFVIMHGEIPNWPDVKSEFEIEVPAPPPAPWGAAGEPPRELPPLAPAGAGSADVTIHTAEGRTNFEPGEPITGKVAWSLPAAPHGIEVRLFWFTRGKGTPDIQTVDQMAIEGPSMQGERAFTFHAPNGPYSFSGPLVSLLWGLEVIAEPKDRSDRIEIVCAPGGREIVPDPALTPPTPTRAAIRIGR